MHSATIVQARLDIIKRYGDWSAHNIRLTDDVYTIREDEPMSRVRARQYLQVAADILRKPFCTMRVLDLACLEGLFSIEFGAHGAEVIGVEGREANISKARFAAETLELSNVSFVQEDVRNLHADALGTFDVVLCLGILYHLPAKDILPFLMSLHCLCRGILIIDTHTSVTGTESFCDGGVTYSGHTFHEHAHGETEQRKRENLWASLDNEESFWLTQSSLLNALHSTGFTSAYAVLHPPIFAAVPDRKTFIALSTDPVCILRASPKSDVQPYEFHHAE